VLRMLKVQIHELLLVDYAALILVNLLEKNGQPLPFSLVYLLMHQETFDHRNQVIVHLNEEGTTSRSEIF
jgi:hypothetical protein